MRIKKRGHSYALFVFLALVTCGCVERSEPGQNVVKIGALLDLTGPAASFGQMQRQGIELAVADINAAPSCKYRPQLVIEDSRLDPKLALGAATKLAHDDQVSAISSITGSSMAMVTAPVFGAASIPVVDSLSSAPSLTGQGQGYYFRIQPADTYAGKYLVEWAAESGKVNRIAIIYADSDWGQGLKESLTSAARAHRMDITITESARPGDIDFRPALLRIRRQAPDLLFLVAHPQESGLIIKQLGTLGYKVPVMGSDSLSTDEVRTAAGVALNGVRFCLSSTGSGPAFESFRKRFKMRYGIDPTVNSIKPYDTVTIIYQAVCKVGPEGKAIQNFLRTLTGFEGIGGPVSFDEHGDIRSPRYDRFEYQGSTFLQVH